MWPKCLKCSQSLSFSWLLGSSMWTKHRCVNCKALHEFTRLHYFLGSFSAALIVASMVILEPYITSSLGRFLLALIIIIPITAFVPSQYRLAKNN